MRTIQMTLDDDLVEIVDRIVNELKTTRSAFTREALQLAIKRYETGIKETRHIQGYQNHPVDVAEFGNFEDEQAWSDE